MANYSKNYNRLKLGKMSNQEIKKTATGFEALTFLTFDKKASRKRLPGKSISLWRSVRTSKAGNTKIAIGATFSSDVTNAAKEAEEKVGITLRVAIGVNPLTNEAFIVFGEEGVEFNHGTNFMIRRPDVVKALFKLASIPEEGDTAVQIIIPLLEVKPLAYKLNIK